MSDSWLMSPRNFDRILDLTRYLAYFNRGWHYLWNKKYLVTINI